MRFEKTADLELVRQILTVPRIYTAIADDFSPPRESYAPPIAPGIMYVLAYDDAGVLLGCFAFWQHSPIVWEVHTCLLPQAWGARAIAAARGMAAWMWQHTTTERIITQIPESNRLAAAFARRAGMTQYGTNPAAVLKGGRLESLELYGMTRPHPTQEPPSPCQPQ